MARHGSGAPFGGLMPSAVITAGGAALMNAPAQTKRRFSSSLKVPTVPTSAAALSVTRNFHAPFDGFPLRTLSGDSGRNDPENGAVPAEMAVAAWSSIAVGVPVASLAPVPKFCPELPRRLTSWTTVPSGCTRLMRRSPSNVWLIRKLTLTSESVLTSATMIGMSTPVRLLSGMATAIVPVL